MAQKKAPNKEAKPAENKGGLTINERQDVPVGNMVTPGKRLFLTRDGTRLVDPGDKDAAILYCTEHDQVRRSEYEKLLAAGG